jgi:hypothetical protein
MPKMVPGPVGRIVVSLWHAPGWNVTAVLSKAVGKYRNVRNNEFLVGRLAYLSNLKFKK